MRPAARYAWLLEYMKKRKSLATGQYEWFDVLNADFVCDYIVSTGAKFNPQPYGAHRCAQLGLDLSALYRDKKLERDTCGIRDGYCHMGFPRWVYVYRVTKEQLTCE